VERTPDAGMQPVLLGRRLDTTLQSLARQVVSGRLPTGQHLAPDVKVVRGALGVEKLNSAGTLGLRQGRDIGDSAMSRSLSSSQESASRPLPVPRQAKFPSLTVGERVQGIS